MTITGTFEVTLAPLDGYAQGSDGLRLGRMSIDKHFHGGLEAVSRGEMLSVMTTVKGSARYVAIEQVSGTLAGKTGSFVLQHFGILNRGDSRLVLEVVPDSGSGELTGLTGTMTITIDGGVHRYTFAYNVA